MTASNTYFAYAEQARREAAVSPLPNVRERLERSAAAWQDMASRAERTEVARDKREAAQGAVARLVPPAG